LRRHSLLISETTIVTANANLISVDYDKCTIEPNLASPFRAKSHNIPRRIWCRKRFARNVTLTLRVLVYDWIGVAADLRHATHLRAYLLAATISLDDTIQKKIIVFLRREQSIE
jgi:hypothetical protein